jgi:hypothetical protein
LPTVAHPYAAQLVQAAADPYRIARPCRSSVTGRARRADRCSRCEVPVIMIVGRAAYLSVRVKRVDSERKHDARVADRGIGIGVLDADSEIDTRECAPSASSYSKWFPERSVTSS